MEDKRTLLAFLLIGVILFSMPYYLEWTGVSPSPTDIETTTPPSSRDSVSTETSTEVPSPSQSAADNVTEEMPAKPALPLAIQAPFTPQDIHVETPLYHLVFSTAGGDLVSAQLLQYLHNNRPVELVPAGGRGLALSVQQRDDILDLSKFEFVPDKDRLSLAAGQSGSFDLIARLENGLTVRKSFRFDGDKYGFAFNLSLEGLATDSQTFISWHKGIASTEKTLETDRAESLPVR